MIKVAIVGTSKADENESLFIEGLCMSILVDMKMDYGLNNVVLISGGAKGVDSIAEKVANRMNMKTMIFKPEVENWGDIGGKIGYRTRNIKIAMECDKLFCIPAKFSGDYCVHCGTDKHQRGGGCWTMKQAKKLGKQTKLIPPR